MPPRSVDGGEVAPSPIFGGQLGILLASGVGGDTWRHTNSESVGNELAPRAEHFAMSAQKTGGRIPVLESSSHSGGACQSLIGNPSTHTLCIPENVQ